MPGKFESPRNDRKRPSRPGTPEQARRTDRPVRPHPAADARRPAGAHTHPAPDSRRPAEAQRHPAPRRRRPRRRNPLPVILLILLLVCGICFFLFKSCNFFSGSENPGTTKPQSSGNLTPATDPVSKETLPPEPTQPEPEKVVATATVISTGDILMHKPVISTGLAGNSYNFDKIFTYAKPYVEAADYAVANLETTLAGTDNGYQYSGYPMFNCPDAIVDSVRDAGFDMLLTANNHSYDTSAVGLDRTVKTIREKGVNVLGTMATADEPKYQVLDIGGIRIGMMCYTYETGDSNPEIPSLNGIPLKQSSLGKINSFDYNQLPKFYSEVQTHIANMKAEGAEAVVIYLHWGLEYNLQQNAQQTEIAQKLCDLGVDVIVGGHPHVVQPMDYLTSTADPNHHTVIIYSMGNAVSNQRRELMNLNTGHTEDGVLFSFTFAKYSDGRVFLQDTDVIPCWVYLHNDGGKQYNILPLDKEIPDWKEAFGFGDTILGYAEESYDRTMAIVGAGLEKAKTQLAAEKDAREQAYLAAVQGVG